MTKLQQKKWRKNKGGKGTKQPPIAPEYIGFLKSLNIIFNHKVLHPHNTLHQIYKVKPVKDIPRVEWTTKAMNWADLIIFDIILKSF